MLLAPGEGEIARAIAAAAAAAGWLVTLAGRPGSGLAGDSDSARSTDGSLPWNPSSYVSAGALTLGAEAKGAIDVLVIVSAPEAGERSIFDGPPGSLATSMEEAALGPVWLCREMIRRFEARRSGRILLVSRELANPSELSPNEAAWPNYVASTFRGFGETLFGRARGAHWKAWGIADRSGKAEALATFALAHLDESKDSKSGRWLPFNGKSGIFGIF